MTLEQIFFASQSISSIAVVGSLIYLAQQVRYAERSQRAIMQQGRANRASQGSLTIANPELARVWQKAMTADPDLTPVEFTQWIMICRAMFLSGEDSFLQFHAGLLDKHAFDSYAAGVRYYMSAAGMRAAWQLTQGQFGKEFRDFVNSMLASTPVVQAAGAQDEWVRLVRMATTGAV